MGLPGFGEAFISWIKLVYAQPLGAVVTNGQQSLGRGTRQGCPLSPLLFAIAIELLAIALRQKSEMFPLNQAASQISPSHFPFKVVKKGFKYLGVEITHTFPLLFIKNFGVLLEKCKQDMVRWSSLPLSLVCRVNLIKMIVLPKFLYLFQNILDKEKVF